MNRRYYLIVVLVSTQLAFTAVASSKTSILDVIPDYELADASLDRGEVTIVGLNAIEAATGELKQKWKLDKNDFESVSVRQAGSSLHVLFSNRELHAAYSGSPGLPRPIIFRVRASDLRVLGSFQYD